MAEQTETIGPVFVTSRSLPAASEKEYTVVEICSAAERVAGRGKIIGSQRIGSLWSIYAKDLSARIELLTRGLILRGHTVQLRDKNPFLRTNKNGEDREIPTTRLTIGNIPMNYPNEEIMEFLQKLPGFKAVSRMMDERARDDKGKLSNWKTGRRLIFIETPDTPLPKMVKMGLFSVSLFHKEQKSAVCANCLGTAHHASACTAPVKCKACLQSGHKMGDSQCEMAPPPPHTIPDLEKPEEKTNVSAENKTTSAQSEFEDTASAKIGKSPTKRKERETRGRSATPSGKKRTRSPSTPRSNSKSARSTTTNPDTTNKTETERCSPSKT